MIGPVFCFLWAHSWSFMFTNGRGRAVLHCRRCSFVRDK